jgi:8-oxo-dGTP pyrophosphatase MutT (NUDIX family)
VTVHGVSCLITDPARSAAILQRKDASYPVLRFRHALACFGGRQERGEPPDTAIRREIEEEIADLPLRAAVLARLLPAGVITTGFGHRVYCYLAVLPDFASHAARITALPQRLICTEGHMEVHALGDLEGMPFAWDAGLVVRTCLDAAQATS